MTRDIWGFCPLMAVGTVAMTAWGCGGEATALLVHASSGPGCVCAADALRHLQPPQKLGSPESGLMWKAAISAKTELICAVRELKGKLVILCLPAWAASFHFF